ncbi:unnamed protein product [Alopecurus aequalis]
MEELQLLSTVDPTSRLEYELLDRYETWQLEDEDKQGPGRNNASHRRRLSFSLAVRKGRFARYSLLIGSRYGIWSAADRRFIKRTNFYHYHHLTLGIRDLRQVYKFVLFDGFYDVRSFPGFLCKLFVRPRHTVQIMRALLFYYHVFMAKDRHMECWPADVHGKDRREELSFLRHRLVDVYQRRMTPAQRQRVQVIYEDLFRRIRIGLGFIFVMLLVLFVIIAWLLNYCW